jgi:uncharacterized RDD family membrane protein YckC
MAAAGAGYSPADSILGVQTPEGIEFALFPAGLPVRSCAYVIDKAIQWVFDIGLLIIMEFLGEAAGIWIILLLLFCVDWFYHVIGEVFFRGQTPGKKIMGIRVVGSDGSPVGGGASFLRNLLRFADTFMFFYPIALVCMSASRAFRRIGDWAAGTLVVYTSHSLAPPPQRPGGHSLSDAWFRNLDPVIPPRPLSGEEREALMVFARRYPLLGEARADEIARPFAAFLECSGRTADGISADSRDRNNSGGVSRFEVPGSAAAFLLGIARGAAGGIL